ncbi:hypothetical protein BX600DRAFT_470631 [Xylariales sp. PMI_506]|nr:hypothetical protein BX600DRAFT_470631 [Xylariales sp. PMI_506]
MAEAGGTRTRIFLVSTVCLTNAAAAASAAAFFVFAASRLLAFLVRSVLVVLSQSHKHGILVCLYSNVISINSLPEILPGLW